MKVQLATQVISSTDSLETYSHLKDLQPTAMASVEILLEFNTFFDMFN